MCTFDGLEFDCNEFALVNDDNANGSDVSPRIQQRVDGIINKIRTYESNKHDGQEFEGNESTILGIDDNADGSNVSSRTHRRFNDKFPNEDNDSDYSRPGRLGNCMLHPPLFMGSYKILELFSTLLFASTMLKISQSMGSDKSIKALIFSLLIISSSCDILQDLQSMGSVKYHKAFVYPREYPSSPVCVNQLIGAYPCLLKAQRVQISLSHGF